MIDQEIYLEEANSKSVFKTILTMVFILGIFSGVYYFYFYHEPIRLKKIEIELGDKPSLDVNDYIKNNEVYEYELDLSKLSLDDEGRTNSTGEYSYTITTDNEELKGKIFVVDTTKPDVVLSELTVGLNEEFDVEDFVESCFDLSNECHVRYQKEADESLTEKEGTYDINLKISDRYGNEVTKKTKLIVKEGASLSLLKSSDTEVYKIYPIDKDWDETYTIKFEKGLHEYSDEFETEILFITNQDFSVLFDAPIKNQTLLSIYNKYHYVIGLSMKFELEDNSIIYLSNEEYQKLKDE